MEIRRGDLFWVRNPRDPDDDAVAHPHVVIQDDVLNRSRVKTVVMCALTTNLKRADEPGNLLLEPGEGGLPKRSVVVVSQVDALDKTRLTDRIGTLSERRVEQVLAGLSFQQRSTR